MPSAFGIAIIGAFQGSLSVLLTILYGMIATRLGMVSPMTIKDMSSLCANIFLPALLISSIGRNVGFENIIDYLPIFVWSLAYALLSMALAKLVERWWKLPSWAVAAITFNNTTSLPLLLTKSFAETGILSPLAGGDHQRAIDRATSYFLINGLVSKIATFTLGPRLFGNDCFDPLKQGSLNLPIKVSDTTALLLEYRSSPPSTPLAGKPIPVFSPTTWSAVFATVIGFSPLLHRLFFAPPQDGGYLSVWVTGSLRNVGELFSVLQIFVVGANLSKSFRPNLQIQSPNPPASALITIFVIRFIFWSLISIPLIYLLATKTTLLSEDPLLWWCMMLMPIGPPAMVLSTLLELIDAGEKGKLMVARMLAFMYGITPVISFAVVGALKACELALKKRGESGL